MIGIFAETWRALDARPTNPALADSRDSAGGEIRLAEAGECGERDKCTRRSDNLHGYNPKAIIAAEANHGFLAAALVVYNQTDSECITESE